MEGVRGGGRGSNQSTVHVPSTIKIEPPNSSNVAHSIYNIACIFSAFHLFGS